MNKQVWMCAYVGLVVAAALGAGCATKKPVVDVTRNGGAGEGRDGRGLAENGPGGSGDGLGGVGLPNRDLSGVHFAGDPSLGTVYFDFDSAVLRSDAIAILDKHAAVIRSRGGSGLIQIAGHCDERGTQEYNLALGERRALAVREYLMKLGVPGDRMVTISFGEEDPADAGHDESAWAQNRRGMFNAEQ